VGEPDRPGTRLGAVTLGLAVTLLAAACVPLAPSPYATPTPSPAPAIDASSVDGFTPAERVALRVWATTCSSYRNGTAWMLDEAHAVTNRHVVEDTTTIELTDYQGNRYAGAAASYSNDDDLAIVTIDGEFPEMATIAAEEPRIGDTLTVSGYGEGGPLTSMEGPYVELRENDLDPDGAHVYFIEVQAREGHSGSPVTDAAGDVVGVLFSSDGETHAGAVTLPRLQVLLGDDADLTEVDASC